MKKKFTNEAKIGLVTVLSLTLLYIGVNYMKGINLFKPANYYYVTCTNARDISVSSPVYVNGFKVGLVRSIEYDYSTIGKIMIEIRLDKGMKVNKGSYIFIESTFLSGAELHIVLNGYVTEYLKPGDTIEGRIKGSMMLSVEENVLPQVTSMLPKIDSILIGLQTLLNNPALQQSLDNIQSTTKQLEASSLQLNTLLRKDIPEITGNLKTATSNLSDFSVSLRQLDLQPSISGLNSALDNINTMTLRLNSRDNSLGLLLNDSTLYNTLNGTFQEASGLLIDIRQNPKRYVKFSLF
ncbi:MAG: MlaD family protein [Tannerella sp.]|jgi:phospholipid/cholesterol/gamma-HCH transport system substrate-binding protein|nr:MlaD family protein [Tannerella sp.]